MTAGIISSMRDLVFSNDEIQFLKSKFIHIGKNDGVFEFISRFQVFHDILKFIFRLRLFCCS